MFQFFQDLASQLPEWPLPGGHESRGWNRGVQLGGCWGLRAPAEGEVPPGPPCLLPPEPSGPTDCGAPLGKCGSAGGSPSWEQVWRPKRKVGAGDTDWASPRDNHRILPRGSRLSAILATTQPLLLRNELRSFQALLEGRPPSPPSPALNPGPTVWPPVPAIQPGQELSQQSDTGVGLGLQRGHSGCGH